MTPALFIKPDGKVYLIVDCPEKPDSEKCGKDMRRSLVWHDYLEDLHRAKGQSILVEDQEYAKILLLSLIHGNKNTDTIYPMPGLKYKIIYKTEEGVTIIRGSAYKKEGTREIKKGIPIAVLKNSYSQEQEEQEESHRNEILEVIAKVHDHIEGRYELDAYDFTVIHHFLCRLSKIENRETSDEQ